MPYDLTEPLVIGISSRALFNLETENKIYEQDGLAAYEEYQVEHEADILQKGSAFQLVKAFLSLNELQDKRLVEVIVMSRNSPNTSLRIFNSIQDYELDITRAALTGGAAIAPYLKAFKTDLFLSAFEPDVKQAINNDTAAGMILTGASHFDPKAKINQIRIAFDGDAVLFASEAERVFQQEGMAAFMENERVKADIPLQKGPFANFLLTLAHIQELFKDKGGSPIRTALVTSRNAPAHERAIKTLRKWNVHIDEAFFLGGVSKRDVLAAFGAHIFFDDQRVHTDPASEVVPSAVVPYREGDDPHQ
ncbi:MAG: 5'-nucleotidase [Firmicutes bacterium]|jgi:5'-nucleotidase|nr:5'-nucleotidase [Bacillota bacterium]